MKSSKNQTAADANARFPDLSPRGILKMLLSGGGPGSVLFTITNACNARCEFCSFSREALPRGQWKFMPYQGACDAMDILYRHNVRFLVLQGGEPTLHPSLDEIIRYAKSLDMHTLLVTNGSLLSERRVRELAEAGLSGFVISIDAMDRKIHESNRGLPGVCERIRRANTAIRDLKLSSTASVTMSRLVEYERIPAFLRSLGFSSVTFSYPLTNLKSTNLSYATSELVNLSDGDLLEAFEKVKRLKKHFHVVNPTPSIEEMQRFIRNEEQRYPCLGGFLYFYLDWNLDLWRCHFWHKPMCSIYEFNDSQKIRDGCTKCMIDCFRDSSVMHQIGISVYDAYQNVRARRIRDAIRALWRSNNLGSLRAVLEQLPWIFKL